MYKEFRLYFYPFAFRLAYHLLPDLFHPLPGFFESFHGLFRRHRLRSYRDSRRPLHEHKPAEPPLPARCARKEQPSVFRLLLHPFTRFF